MFFPPYMSVCPVKSRMNRKTQLSLFSQISMHDNGPEDRRWGFECKPVTDFAFDSCSWTGWKSCFDKCIWLIIIRQASFSHCETVCEGYILDHWSSWKSLSDLLCPSVLHWCFHFHSKGSIPCPKRMNFWKSSKRPLTPPSFSEIMLRIFSKIHDRSTPL